ncbi:MAG: S9 family peptidase [Clostridia bacterium]|nr:S9 family peptidase [Clostridia bacterium]
MTMKPIPIDLFCGLKFVSDVTLSPSGKNVCFVVTNADKEKNSYRSYIYTLRDGRPMRLTGGGSERRFMFLDDDTLLFPGSREEKEKDPADTSSRYYRISLNGGEAEPAFTFPIRAGGLMPLPNGETLLTGSTAPGFEDLYKGDKKYLAAYRKHVKENADYEEIAQAPWWWNGGTFTKGAYSSLYIYDKKKKLKRLTALNENVSGAKLTPDKRFVYYIASPVTPRLQLMGGERLCRMKVGEWREEEITASREGFYLQGFEPAKSFLYLMAADGHNGLNTDGDFYSVDYDTNEIGLVARHGEAIGSSVGSDNRYGGERAVRADGDALYFISTRFDCADIYKLENGVITQVTDWGGSVDTFDVKDGRLIAVALKDMRAQELYNGRGRRLTRFNDAALRAKYVGVPERLDFIRNGVEIHGFVIKPMGYEPGKKYPVVLDVHGGPKTVYGPVFYHEMQYWAGKGYFVIFCNPTGSDGRGDFMNILGRYGTVDYDDIMAFCDEALKKYPDMDADDMFETGGSYGGFMTNWIVSHTDRFRAACAQRSISNWLSFYGVSDIGLDFVPDQNAADPWGSPEKLWERSPMKYADKVKTPLLLIHSFEDYRCPIDQAYQMFASLVDHGVESKIVAFRGENHELSRSGKPLHRLKRLSEITAWFDSHRKK